MTLGTWEVGANWDRLVLRREDEDEDRGVGVDGVASDRGDGMILPVIFG